MKENDILLGRFADAHIDDLSDEQLDRYETLMEQNDIDLMNWIVGKTPVPKSFDHDVMHLIQRVNKTV